jgi:hypothetical protein
MVPLGDRVCSIFTDRGRGCVTDIEYSDDAIMPALPPRLVAAIVATAMVFPAVTPARSAAPLGRERLSIDAGWKFTKGDAAGFSLRREELVPWLLPTSHAFISDPARRQPLPAGRLDGSAYAQRDFDDRTWRSLNLPHDRG